MSINAGEDPGPLRGPPLNHGVRPHNIAEKLVATETLPSLRARLESQGAPASQVTRLLALRSLCERSPECVALALVGSFAKQSGDRISDLDLAAFVSPGAEATFLQHAHELLAADELLSEYGKVYPGQAALRKYVYLDFTSCDFYAFSLHMPFRLRRPFIPVWDPAEFLASLVVDEPPPLHETFEAYQHGDEGLIWELIGCVKWLRRGRNQLAKDYLRKLVRAIDERENSSKDPSGAA